VSRRPRPRVAPLLRRVPPAGLGALAGLLVPAVASAHTLSGRVDTPLPFVAYLVGAAIAVGVSFAVVAISDPGPPRDPTPATIRAVPRWFRVLLQAIGLLAWLWIVAQTIIGGSSDADVASLFLWVYGWVALAIISALLGPAWSWLDPFTTLHDLGAWLLRLVHVEGIAPQPYPERLACWPAIAGFGFFVWLELVAKTTGGRQLGLALIAYTAVTLVAMAQWGRDAWRARGETFSVWFGLIGRLAILARASEPEEGRVHRRPFGTGLMVRDWPLGLVLLASFATGSILYDGISQTKLFFDLFGIPDLLKGTLLLIGFEAILAALVLLVARRVGLPGIGAGLVPVAVGYLVAHYATALLVDGQRIFIAVSDPFQQGWDLFGTAFWQPRTDLLPTGLLWSVQVGAVVVGHIIGAWAGHGAVQAESREGQRVSQLPLALLMVGLTTLTLWSLGQNLIFEAPPATTSAAVTPAVTACRPACGRW
jgi:hypothetical protein